MSNEEIVVNLNEDGTEKPAKKVERELGKVRTMLKKHKDTLIKIGGGFVVGTVATVGAVRLTSKKSEPDSYEEYAYESELYLDDDSDTIPFEVDEVTAEVSEEQ